MDSEAAIVQVLGCKRELILQNGNEEVYQT